MVNDIEQLLQRSAVGPSRQVDAAQIVGRGRRRRRWRQGFAGGSTLALIALAVVVGVMASERQVVEFDQAAPPTETPRTDLSGDEDWEVMAVGVTPVSRPSRIAAHQEELDEAWTWFEMVAPPPVLPAVQGALIGSVAGDCDDASNVLGIERIRADDRSGAIGEFGVMHIDPDCAFIDRFGSASRGPRTLYVIGVPVDRVHTLLGFEAVSAPVADLDWRLLAVEPAVGNNAIGVGQADQAMLDWAWSAWHVGEEAPRLPDGWSAFAFRVPGSCTDASQLHGVEALGYLHDDGFGTVGLAAQFDPACAERESGPDQPRSLYVVTVPTNLADTLHGPWPYIACDNAANVGACEGADRELIHLLWDTP